MTVNGTGSEPPTSLRRLEESGSAALRDQVAVFEDLQMVLRCCERLVTELGSGSEPDAVVVEAVWTTALLSYARCFATDRGSAALGEDDVRATHANGDEVVKWHQLLLQLRDLYADPVQNPREQFTVGVSQDADGGVAGVAITSAPQPLVDDLTVRQTGAIAYALSGIANLRIEVSQGELLEELKRRSKAELDALEPLEVVAQA